MCRASKVSGNQVNPEDLHWQLTHGSFASIFKSLGQEALELQLERFFTVWAWKWDLEYDMDFAGHLGSSFAHNPSLKLTLMPQTGALMHPMHRSQIPILDSFASEYLESFATFVITPPYVVPSTRLMQSEYPNVLISHILSRIPPSSSPPPQNAAVKLTSTDVVESPDKHILDIKNTNQTIRAVAPFINMDMRNIKWMWNGLSFPKTSSVKHTTPSTPTVTSSQPTLGKGSPEEQKPDSLLAVQDISKVEIDAESLREAMSSENEHGLASNVPSPSLPETVPLPPSPPVSVRDGPTSDLVCNISVDKVAELHDTPTALTTAATSLEEEVPRKSLPEFLSTPIYLARAGGDPTQTIKHNVHHVTVCSQEFLL